MAEATRHGEKKPIKPAGVVREDLVPKQIAEEEIQEAKLIEKIETAASSHHTAGTVPLPSEREKD